MCLVDGNHVRHIEYAGAARCYSISYGRSAKRVLHREGLKHNVVDKKARVARLTLDPAEESIARRSSGPRRDRDGHA